MCEAFELIFIVEVVFLMGIDLGESDILIYFCDLVLDEVLEKLSLINHTRSKFSKVMVRHFSR